MSWMFFSDTKMIEQMCVWFGEPDGCSVGILNACYKQLWENIISVKALQVLVALGSVGFADTHAAVWSGLHAEDQSIKEHLDHKVR